jgi:hypothetical protein
MDIGTEFPIDKIAESATLFAQAAIIDGVADANGAAIRVDFSHPTIRRAVSFGGRPAARAVRFTDFMGRAARFLTWVREQL